MSVPFLSFEITGLEETLQRFQHRQVLLLEALGSALYQEGEAIKTAAQKIVPHDWGTLESSGYVMPPEYEGGNTATVIIGFGGAAKEYALVQHENLYYEHDPGRQAKYLETPAVAAHAGMSERVAHKITAYMAAHGVT